MGKASAAAHRVKGGSTYIGQDFDGCNHALKMLSAISVRVIEQCLLQERMLSAYFYPSRMRPEYVPQPLT